MQINAENPVRIMILLISVSLMLGVLSTVPVHATFPNSQTINKIVEIELYIEGIFEDTVAVTGTAELEWSDPIVLPGGYHLIETEIVEMNLTGQDSILGEVIITLNPDSTTLGSSLSLAPWEDFPAESFFDIYFYMELPNAMPDDTLYNLTPVHIEAVISQMPPYFELYEVVAGTTLVYDKWGMEIGHISAWFDESIPYAPPSNLTFIDENIDVAIAHDDTIRVQALYAGVKEPDVAIFGIRLHGASDPFEVFATDNDGSEPSCPGVNPPETGDGWSGYLDISGYPLEGDYFDIRSCVSGEGFMLCDTAVTFIDPTPPIPTIISFPVDSVPPFMPDTTYNIIFTSMAEKLSGAFCLGMPIRRSKKQWIPPIDQKGLNFKDKNGKTCDNEACVPAAVAGALMYWFDKGYTKLGHPGGDTTKPEQSYEEVGRELAHYMGTTKERGTSIGKSIKGTRKYLKAHQCFGWTVRGWSTRSGYRSLVSIYKEFEEDETIVLTLNDTTYTDEGDPIISSHTVTMASMETSIRWDPIYHTRIEFHSIDYMDPGTGTPGDENRYEIEVDENNRIVFIGNDLDNDPDTPTCLAAFVKISPPPGKSGKMSSLGRDGAMIRPPRGAPLYPEGEWIMIDSGPATGNGNPDTLRWNTAGFDPGVYLMKIVTGDTLGNEASDMRMCFIPDLTVDVDSDEMPGITTKLRGSYPNPFNPTTTIEFTLAKEAKASLIIYDIAGRRVRQLISDKKMNAGSNKVIWDGLNDHGNNVASGVYFCRLAVGGFTEAKKIVLLR